MSSQTGACAAAAAVLESDNPAQTVVHAQTAAGTFHPFLREAPPCAGLRRESGTSPHARLGCSLFVLITALSTWGLAHAETWGVASFVGTSLTVVTHRAQVGSNLSAGQQAYEVTDDAFDAIAFEAAERVLLRHDPNAQVIRFAIRDAAWQAAARSAAIAEDSTLDKVLAPILASARRAAVTRLLLVVPALMDVRIDLRHTAIGSGRAAGLGLYIDSSVEVTRRDTGELARGFLGVFAHYRIAVIDVATSRQLAEARVRKTSSFSAARAPDRTPLNALSSEQKMIVFRDLLSSGLYGELPPLLTRP